MADRGQRGATVSQAARETSEAGVIVSGETLADVPERELSRLRVVSDDDYELRADLAKGGMGRIVEAWDRRHDRPVAIKMLKDDARSRRSRFAREMHITARLQHPSIVPLYEAARWPTGEPFFAMKLVLGEPLSAIIERTRSLKERLALLPHLVAVAEAIAYAHAQRVVHRDLKPSNVIVGAFGETVVIDWGLAKHLDDTVDDSDHAPAAPRDATLTVEGRAIGTPCYMPPEQARGEAVDERADVYAIGAMLYHLFAGAPPYAGRTSEEIVRAVAERPPPPLAARVDDLPRDLGAVVEKAMARDPEARYPTAKEIAEDLARYVAGKLVSAHAYSLGALARRFVRRHLGAVAVAAALLVAMTVGAIASVRVIVRERDRANAARALADDARRVAENDRDAAEQLVAFVVGDLKARLEPLGRLDLLTTVGSRVEDYYAHVSDQAPSAATMSRRAAALQTLATVARRERDPEGALRLLRGAADLRARAAALAPDDDANAFELVEVHFSAGSVLADIGRTRESNAELAQANALADALRPAAKQSSAGTLLVAYARTMLVGTFDPPDPARDAALLSEARDLLTPLVQGPSPDPLARQRLAVVGYTLGRVDLGRGDLPAAARDYREAAALFRALHAELPDDSANAQGLAWSLIQLAEVVSGQGDAPAAEAAFREARDTCQESARHDPANKEIPRCVGASEHALCRLAREGGRPAEAVERCRAALAIETAAASRPPTLRDEDDSIEVRSDLAEAELDRGDLAAAAAALAPAVEIVQREAVPAEDEDRWRELAAIVHLAEAKLALARGRPEEAAEEARAGSAVLAQRRAPSEDPGLALDLPAELEVIRGDAERATGERAAAAEAYDRAAEQLARAPETPRTRALAKRIADGRAKLPPPR